MNSLLIIRFVLIIIVFGIIMFFIKLNRSFKIDRRVSRYSIDSIIDDNNSIIDILGRKYDHLIRRARKKVGKVELLNRQSFKYDKYLYVGDAKQLIDFIIIKLLVGICFVLLVVISLSIQGRVISFFGMIIGFIFGYYIYDIYLYCNICNNLYQTVSSNKRIKCPMRVKLGI